MGLVDALEWCCSMVVTASLPFSSGLMSSISGLPSQVISTAEASPLLSPLPLWCMVSCVRGYR